MRRISFALTRDQLLDGSKSITRRLGWRNLKPGQSLLAVSKCMGLRPGEKADIYGVIEVVSVRFERLDAIDQADVIREGFPDMTPAEFVAFFCRTHKGCSPETEVTRIEFANGVSVAPAEYRVLVADPPWPFDDNLPGPKRGARKHYRLMTLAEICEMSTPKLADDCWFFLWRPATHQLEAMQVARAWGFERAPSELIWRKMTLAGDRVRIGMGRGFRNAHETCLVFKRGRPERLSAALPSVFDAPRLEHSRKPDRFYELVDEFAPGPKVELFARRQWKEWMCFGDELPTQGAA